MATAARPMRIVTELSPRAWPVRMARSFVTLAGYALVLVAIGLAVPALVLLIVLPLGAATGGEVPANAVIALVLFGLGSFILLRIGLRIARGRRHLVLFLRRFGFDDASETLTLAVSGAMGRRWRLVTLDDSEIEAVGVHHASRLTWGIGRWVALLLFVLAIGAAANWWFSGGVEGIVNGIFDSALENSEESGQNAFEAAVGAFIAALVGGIVVVALIVMFALTGISILGVWSIGLWQGDRAVRRAEGAKTFALNDPAEVEPLVDRIRKHAAQIQSPRLIVLKVHDRIWQRVVRELADEASVALVDVSDPSEHLLWEVALLRGDVNARMLAVGRRDRVEALLAADASGTASRLREALAGEDVLVYEPGGDRGSVRRFARNLSFALDRADG